MVTSIKSRSSRSNPRHDPVKATVETETDTETGDQPLNEVEVETKGENGNENVENLPATSAKGFLAAIKKNAKAALRHTTAGGDKMQLIGTIRQHLAEVADIAAEVGEGGTKVEEAASVAAKELYNARMAGTINNEEISAMLGDVFGFRITSTGAQSKTPDGTGKTIRDRVFRIIKAAEYATSGEGDRFFAVLPQDTVAELVESVENDDASIWTVYHDLSELRKGNLPARVPLAFDPKRLGTVALALTEEGAAKNLADNPGLVKAYLAIMDGLEPFGLVDAWIESREEAEAQAA
jgi:hypothetical protein